MPADLWALSWALVPGRAAFKQRLGGKNLPSTQTCRQSSNPWQCILNGGLLSAPLCHCHMAMPPEQQHRETGVPCLLHCRRYPKFRHHDVVHVSLALQVAINYDPLAEGFTIWVTLCSIYLAIFVLYWLYCLVRLHSAAHSTSHLTLSTARCMKHASQVLHLLQGSAAL